MQFSSSQPLMKYKIDAVFNDSALTDLKHPHGRLWLVSWVILEVLSDGVEIEVYEGLGWDEYEEQKTMWDASVLLFLLQLLPRHVLREKLE